MSVAADVLFKALEVGAATAATRALSATAAPPPAPAPVPAPAPARRGIFRRRVKEEKTEPAAGGKGDLSAAAAVLMAGVLGGDGSAARVGEVGGFIGDTVGGVARAARADVWVRLAVCVLVDLVGSGSLAVPLLGDALDLVTAPVTALLLQAIFGDPRVTGGVLAEELLPGTDVVPSATIAWFAQEAGWLRENGLRVEPGVRDAAQVIVAKGVEGLQEAVAASAVEKDNGRKKGRNGKGRGGKKDATRESWW